MMEVDEDIFFHTKKYHDLQEAMILFILLTRAVEAGSFHLNIVRICNAL
jgi:hypothetical protein